jgi:hypothetical protein
MKVTTVPLIEVPEIGPKLVEWVKSVRPKTKECHLNAYLCMDANPGVKVAKGYSGYLPHSWNEYKGVYFDVTNGLRTWYLNEGKRQYHTVRYSDYELVRCLDKREIYTYMMKTGRHDDYLDLIKMDAK